MYNQPPRREYSPQKKAISELDEAFHALSVEKFFKTLDQAIENQNLQETEGALIWSVTFVRDSKFCIQLAPGLLARKIPLEEEHWEALMEMSLDMQETQIIERLFQNYPDRTYRIGSDLIDQYLEKKAYAKLAALIHTKYFKITQNIYARLFQHLLEKNKIIHAEITELQNNMLETVPPFDSKKSRENIRSCGRILLLVTAILAPIGFVEDIYALKIAAIVIAIFGVIFCFLSKPSLNDKNQEEANRATIVALQSKINHSKNRQDRLANKILIIIDALITIEHKPTEYDVNFAKENSDFFPKNILHRIMPDTILDNTMTNDTITIKPAAPQWSIRSLWSTDCRQKQSSIACTTTPHEDLEAGVGTQSLTNGSLTLG